jgi:hypothetical protein
LKGFHYNANLELFLSIYSILKCHIDWKSILLRYTFFFVCIVLIVFRRNFWSIRKIEDQLAIIKKHRKLRRTWFSVSRM